MGFRGIGLGERWIRARPKDLPPPHSQELLADLPEHGYRRLHVAPPQSLCNLMWALARAGRSLRLPPSVNLKAMLAVGAGKRAEVPG